MRLRGTYTIEPDSVTVRSGLGVKATQLRGFDDPHAIARQLLLELLEEPKAGF